MHLLSNLLITLLAYFIDRFFGEFPIKHPVIYIGELITFFQKHFYKDSVIRGFFLVIFTLSITLSIAEIITYYLAQLPLVISILFHSIIASMFIAHNMLRSSVASIIDAKDKHHAISMLVSRDTKDLSHNDIYKAAIETYAENLSDGVIAPVFYLLFFGLPGIVFYKTLNTLDSMVGYRTKEYEKYGKVAAKLDDLLNYIPARLTALLIMFLGKQKNLFAFYHNGSQHASPNAGHPITAMALVLGIKLGGDTSYFGKIHKKATFGNGRCEITAQDIKKALKVL